MLFAITNSGNRTGMFSIPYWQFMTSLSKLNSSYAICTDIVSIIFENHKMTTMTTMTGSQLSIGVLFQYNI